MPDLQINGRPRRAQQGVDIWGLDSIWPLFRRPVQAAHRCALAKAHRGRITNAENFQPALSALYIATSDDYGSKLLRDFAGGINALVEHEWNRLADPAGWGIERSCD
jgi:hypothetical protein